MPRQGKALFIQSVKAAGNITERRFVGFDGNQASVAGQACAGVAQCGGKVGDYVPVTMLGSEVVEVGGALAAGDYVVSDAQGRAVKAADLTVAAGATAVTSTAANGAILAGSVTPQKIIAQVAPGEAAAGAGAFVEIIFR